MDVAVVVNTCAGIVEIIKFVLWSALLREKPFPPHLSMFFINKYTFSFHAYFALLRHELTSENFSAETVEFLLMNEWALQVCAYSYRVNKLMVVLCYCTRRVSVFVEILNIKILRCFKWTEYEELYIIQQNELIF